MKHHRAAAFLLALVCSQSFAQTATVRVPGTRDPVDKSYRKMIAGMDRFEREHALAPAATLRFRLLPRKPGTDLRGVSLRVAGDSISVPIALASDYSFMLERNAQALREDADVLANRKTNSITWRAWVQTPGLPPDTRRLGDLRLECRVGMDAGLISNSSPLFGWLSNALTSTEQVCNQPDGNYLFFTERPVFGVTLRYGARSMVLPFRLMYSGGKETPESLPYCDCQALLDRSYFAPLWDRSWPDDTLLEFEYMEPAP
ncbi:MAG: hypothetical protein V4508_00610 [Pseudomonadota bacterium]